MKRQQERRVESLLDYIQVMKEERLEECISRGENARYPQICAAAFRRNGSLDIQAMVDEFQSYIGNSLTEMQNRHFLAFSQHYGLPTNLLDFSYSPLISLYFACSGNEEKEGYVYFLSKERLIDITRNLDLVKPGLFSQLLLAAPKTEALYDGITKFFCQDERYVAEFLEGIDRMIGRLPRNERVHRALRQALRTIRTEGVCSMDDLESLIKILDRNRPFAGELEPEIKTKYLGAFGHIFCRVLSYAFLIRDKDAKLEFPFYFTYEPANITARVSNQSSILIYQLYGIDNLRQAIIPDFEVTIANKEEILSDLDHLGINEKFIFNDYDHIASYIKRKHLKTADETEEKWTKIQKMAGEFPIRKGIWYQQHKKEV